MPRDDLVKGVTVENIKKTQSPNGVFEEEVIAFGEMKPVELDKVVIFGRGDGILYKNFEGYSANFSIEFRNGIPTKFDLKLYFVDDTIRL